MSVLVADRLRRGGRAARAVAVGLLVALALPVVAATSVAPERWVARRGDDLAWSQPAFDDAAWPTADPRSSWRELGEQGYDGMLWFRGVAKPTDDASRPAARNDLGILLGPPACGAYELFAGGRSVGRSRGWSAPLAFGFAEVFRIPREAIGRDGTIRLALRARRTGWISDADDAAGPVSGTLTIGSYTALSDHVQVAWTRHLLRELPLLILAALFAFTAVRHLLLFGRRQQESEHLWFGLLSLAFAVNTFASTYWIYGSPRTAAWPRASPTSPAISPPSSRSSSSGRSLRGRSRVPSARTSSRTPRWPRSSDSGRSCAPSSRAAPRAGSGCCRCWRSQAYSCCARSSAATRRRA